MLHFTAVVSRKTPLDGRLEIPSSVADRLKSSAGALVASVQAEEFAVRVEAMACTCAKGAGGNHEHHFLVAESLKTLRPEARVTVLIDLEAGRIRLEDDR